MAKKPRAPRSRSDQAVTEGEISVSQNGIAANGHAEASAPESDTPTIGTRALSNVSPETIQEYVRRLKSAKADTEEKRIAAKAAQKAVSSCVGFERVILKDAKRNGLNTERLIQACEMMSRDPEEVAREMAELDWYLKAMNHKTDSQLSILDYAKTITDGIAKGAAIVGAVEAEDRETIMELGKRAGLAGKPATDCPYEEGSPDGLLWTGGWREGQAENMGPLAAGGVVAEAGATAH